MAVAGSSATAAPVLYSIGVSSGANSGDVSGASGSLGAIGVITLPVETNGPDATTTFTYGLSKVSGSSKLSASQIQSATAGNTPGYSVSWSGLSVGETVEATWRVTASKTGYQTNSGTFTIGVTRTS